MAREHSLFCVFADDVRQENNGKQIVIGIYQGGMNVSNALPTNLAQFYILAHLLVPVAAPQVEHLKFIADFNGKVLIEVEPPDGAFKLSSAQSSLDHGADAPSVMQLTVGLQPFHIEQQGKVTTRMVINRSIEVVGNSLTITHVPPVSTE